MRHIVTAFDTELNEVDQLIREMGELASKMTATSTHALIHSDNELAQKIIADDEIMDAMQLDLDERAITLIARRQPMAQDLRSVIGAIRMAADLERIGDLAKNIAKRVSVAAEGTASRSLSQPIETMAGMVLEQIRLVVEHYVNRDAEALTRLRDADEKIDIQYTSIFRELLTYMMEDPRNISSCTHLLFCAKNLERIGDHVTNIAENAHFIITGEQLSVQRPRHDETQETGSDADMDAGINKAGDDE